MRSLGVLIVRLVVGGLLAGHGAQKLFGAFGGGGLTGTTRWLESMRLRPADAWARLAGGSELGGGLLTMLGLLNPLGPIAAIGAMAMAWLKVHLGKPVWVTKGGAELPLTNLAVLSALTIAGPGRLSVDGLVGIRLPRWLGLAALASTFAALWLGAREELERGLASLAGGDLMASGDEPGPAADEPDTSRPVAGGTVTEIAVMDIEPMDLPGAAAGTALGSGSVLGSETPDEA